MVLNTRPAPPTPALVVPDEQTWTVLGIDPASLKATPAFAAGRVERVLVSEHVPSVLSEPLAAWLAAVPRTAGIEQHPLAMPADASGDGDASAHQARDPHRHGDHGDRGDHGDHSDHGHHDGHDSHGGHHDMMAIVGEPSADGLVMEPIEVTYGPLGTPLPGGVLVEATLDGDVVAKATVRALLSRGTGGDPPEPPDLLAPVAWRAAIARAAAVDLPASDRWLNVAEVELERAVSHLAWLRSFGRLLGWQQLIESCTDALGGLARTRTALVSGVESALLDLEATRRLVIAVGDRSRRGGWLRLRLRGRAVTTRSQVKEAGLRGPLARATGLFDDARSDDPLYRRLGFTPVVHSEGDALARTLVRIDEAVQAVTLASAALKETSRGEAAGTVSEARASGLVEGPRGPLQAERTPDGWRLVAHGAASAIDAAADAMVGAEWSTALAVLASFDVSSWRLEQ